MLSEVRRGRAWFELHRPLVVRVVRRLGRRARLAEREQLLSAGYLGLCDARNRYDPSRGLPFAAYATVRIRGAVLDELRAADPLSRRDRGFVSYADRCAARSAQIGTRRALDDTESEVVGISRDALDRARLRAQGIASLDPSDLDYLPARSLWAEAPDLDEAIDRRRRMRRLVWALRALPPRERMVVGFHYESGTKLTEIAGLLGVTPSRVSQLLARALRQLTIALSDG